MLSLGSSPGDGSASLQNWKSSQGAAVMSELLRCWPWANPSLGCADQPWSGLIGKKATLCFERGKNASATSASEMMPGIAQALTNLGSLIHHLPLWARSCCIPHGEMLPRWRARLVLCCNLNQTKPCGCTDCISPQQAHVMGSEDCPWFAALFVILVPSVTMLIRRENQSPLMCRLAWQRSWFSKIRARFHAHDSRQWLLKLPEQLVRRR